ncbi:MAG: type 1 glutamine amidotransferase domain-containing protein [bacterium]|nr:type 1 glutamine amidotransferase domain-containing protein [bacterium]
MSKHVLIAVTNTSRWGEHDKPTGLWFGELTHFVHAIEKAGHTWELCSPKGGAIPLDPRSLGWMFMKASDKVLRADVSFMARLQNTQATADVDASGFDAIFYAGGHGTMWDFPDDPSLQRIAAEIYQRGGFVAAVCHGVAGLLNVERADGSRLIDGATVTGYSDFEEFVAGDRKFVPYSLQSALSERGATFKKAFAPFSPNVCIDGRVVTGQNPRSAGEVGQTLARLMG